jgi:hypothetical protein
VPGRRHHPAHGQRRSELGRLSGAQWAGADDFLKGDDVGVDGGEDGGDAADPRAAVESPRPVDVVGRDANGVRPAAVVFGHLCTV